MPDPQPSRPDPGLRAALPTLLDIVGDGVIVTDRRGVIRYFNTGAVQIFGYPASDVIGQPLSCLLPHRHAKTHGGYLAGFAVGPEDTRWMTQRAGVTGRRADGSEFPAEVTIAKWVHGEDLLLAAVVRDVTERERLRRRDHLIAQAGERLAETLDVEQTLGAVLDAALTALGEWAIIDVVEDQRPDRPLLRRASHHDDIQLEGALRGLERQVLTHDAPSPVVDVLRTGTALRIDPVTDDWMEGHSLSPEELTLLRQLHPHAILIMPVPGRDRVIAALSIGVSTEGRNLPSDVEAAAEALATVAGLEITNALLYRAAEAALVGRDRVLEIVAHDLRNLSSAARMCAIALEGDPEAAPAIRAELYGTIRESSDAIHRLVGDLVDLAAIDRGQLPVRLAPDRPSGVVSSAAALFRERAQTAGITLVTQVAETLPVMAIDRERMTQALANLLHNALKFTPAGGRITVAAETTPDGVVIAVADTGAGMSAERLEEVLTAEWRAKAGPGGSGLGLPITRGIVAAHGGTLDATSLPGEGTTFRILLPLLA